MKRSKLKHSFDDIRISDDKKKEILKKLNSSAPGRTVGLLKPALAMALVAVMLGGIYFGQQLLKSPWQSAGPTSTTTTEDTRTLKDLSVYHDQLIQPAMDKSYTISPEKWQEISQVLARAEFKPEINAITMELRENDLNILSEGISSYFVREFKEIYYANGEVFEAFSLSEEDSRILEEQLRSLMELTIDDPSGELSLLPLLDRPFDTLWHIMPGLEYNISKEQWNDIAAILKTAEYQPDIQFVTEELRDSDLHLKGAFNVYLFLRDYREIYLSSQNLFAAYSLSEDNSYALKTLLTSIMVPDNIKEIPTAPADPTDDLNIIPVLDLTHFRLSHPYSQEDYNVSPNQWRAIRAILQRATWEPEWNAMTDDLRESDMSLFNNSQEHLFMRDYQQIILTGVERFVGYSLTDGDAALLKTAMEEIIQPDNLYSGNEGYHPGGLPYLSMADRTSVQLTDKNLEALSEILQRAEYVKTLGMVELIAAKEGQSFIQLLSEEPELILTNVTESGDVFVETGIALSKDTRRNLHYRLSPEDIRNFFLLSEAIMKP